MYSSGIWDGHPDSFKRCAVCDALSAWLEQQGACVTFRGLQYAVSDYLFEDVGYGIAPRELPPLFGLHAALLQKVAVPCGAIAE